MKLTAENLKNELWDALKKVKSGDMPCAQADSIAVQAREILRTKKTQLLIVAAAKTKVPTELIEFAGQGK